MEERPYWPAGIPEPSDDHLKRAGITRAKLHEFMKFDYECSLRDSTKLSFEEGIRLVCARTKIRKVFCDLPEEDYRRKQVQKREKQEGGKEEGGT